MAGWLDLLRLKLTQSSTGVGVKVATELGNMKETSILSSEARKPLQEL